MTPLENKHGNCTRFKVTSGNSFRTGDIIELYKDDITRIPMFKRLVDDAPGFAHVNSIEPYVGIKQFDVIDVMGSDGQWIVGRYLFLADTTSQDLQHNSLPIKGLSKNGGLLSSFKAMRPHTPKPTITVQIDGENAELSDEMIIQIQEIIK